MLVKPRPIIEYNMLKFISNILFILDNTELFMNINIIMSNKYIYFLHIHEYVVLNIIYTYIFII